MKQYDEFIVRVPRRKGVTPPRVARAIREALHEYRDMFRVGTGVKRIFPPPIAPTNAASTASKP